MARFHAKINYSLIQYTWSILLRDGHTTRAFSRLGCPAEVMKYEQLKSNKSIKRQCFLYRRLPNKLLGNNNAIEISVAADEWLAVQGGIWLSGDAHQLKIGERKVKTVFCSSTGKKTVSIYIHFFFFFLINGSSVCAAIFLAVCIGKMR